MCMYIAFVTFVAYVLLLDPIEYSRYVRQSCCTKRTECVGRHLYLKSSIADRTQGRKTKHKLPIYIYICIYSMHNYTCNYIYIIYIRVYTYTYIYNTINDIYIHIYIYIFYCYRYQTE